QVFLYDTTATSPTPIQLTSYTDNTMLINKPQTDGRHVAWLRGSGAFGTTTPEIDLGTGIQLAAGVGQLPMSPSPDLGFLFQLNRGQILWKDSAGRLRYETASSSFFPDLPGTVLQTWLSDGFIAYGDSAVAGSFRAAAALPNDTQQPAAPLVLLATAGSTSITLNW